MLYKERYSIGDMSRVCNISKKALRYYDHIGLITSQRQDYNNYRYYTRDSLLAVPVIKYYKQMGFTLEEMKSFIEGNVPNVFRTIKNSFKAKITELDAEQEAIRRKHESVKDWYDLIIEAQLVIDNAIQQVSVKFVERQEMIFLEQTFDNDLKAAIINIDFTNFLERVGNEITGPVILNYSSFSDRIKGKRQPMRIIQKNLMPCAEEDKFFFGGCLMVSCYHIGAHETLNETYRKITTWARQHDYLLDTEFFERYVTDYWTTSRSSYFVTEVLIRITKKGQADAHAPAEAQDN